MNINREILRHAIPSLLANITIPLVGLVDTAIIGHISDASAIGGIAVGTMLFDLLYWNFGFLRVGTAGMTAQAWGEQHLSATPADRHSTDTKTFGILSQSVSIALWAAAAILVLQWAFLWVVMSLMPCSEEVRGFATQYFFIRIWAAPATLTLMAVKGWFIGMQDTVSPMLTDIVVNIINIAASYLLAVKAEMGIAGVAWGTVIAQYTGLSLAAIILLSRYHLPHIILRLNSLAQTLKTQLSSFYGQLFIRSLCFMLVYVGYTIIASQYGDAELAASNIMMKLFMLFSYFIDGFAYAGEALTGRFIGEHNTDNQNRTVRTLFIWTAAIGIAGSLIYWLLSTPIINMITNDAETIKVVSKYILWLALMPALSAIAFMWDGIYVGACAGKEIRQAMIWAATGFIITYFALQHLIGTHALYLAYMVHLVVRSLYLTLQWGKHKGHS